MRKQRKRPPQRPAEAITPQSLRDLLANDVLRAGQKMPALQQVIEHNAEAFEPYERLLGLSAPSPEFRRKLIEAIVLCVDLQRNPPPTDRDIHKGLAAVNKAAAALSKDFLALYRALDDVAPQYRKWLLPVENTNWPVTAKPDLGRAKALLYDRAARLNIEPAMLPAEAARFNELSAIAARHAKMRVRIDKGGAPKMLAFSALVTELACAFNVATGDAAGVTWNDHEGRYKGRFLALVEAVLPLARGLTEVFGMPLRYPQHPLARGKYVYDHTRAGRKRHRMYTEPM